MIEKNTEDYVDKTFNKIIGYLNSILSYDSYKDAKKSYGEVLELVKKWHDYYLENKNLSIIEPNKINEIYEKLEDLKTKWLFSKELGNESKLSDQIIIWFIELMKIKNKNHF